MPQGQNAVWHLVVIGDSTLWGVGEAYATLIEEDMGVKVELNDFSIMGLSAGQVLEVLRTGESPNMKLQEFITALRDAEAVIMFVNPVDSIDPEKPLKIMACLDVTQADTSCAPETFEKWTTD